MITNGKDYIERRIEHGLKDIGYVESLYPEYFWEDHHRRVFVEYVVKILVPINNYEKEQGSSKDSFDVKQDIEEIFNQFGDVTVKSIDWLDYKQYNDVVHALYLVKFSVQVNYWEHS